MEGEDLKQKAHDTFAAAEKNIHWKLTNTEPKNLMDPLKAIQY